MVERWKFIVIAEAYKSCVFLDRVSRFLSPDHRATDYKPAVIPIFFTVHLVQCGLFYFVYDLLIMYSFIFLLQLFAISLGDGTIDYVGLGYHSISEHGDPNQQFIQGTWVLHEKWGKGSVAMDNDIGLIHLDTPAMMNNDVKDISIASSEPKKGLELLVSGWGSHNRKFLREFCHCYLFFRKLEGNKLSR